MYVATAVHGVSMNNVVSRLHGLSAAGRYCSNRNVDPDDSGLIEWHAGRITDEILLTWKCSGPVQKQSRIIAVRVATDMWHIERAEGHLWQSDSVDDESPVFHAYNEILATWVSDQIDNDEFDRLATPILAAISR